MTEPSATKEVAETRLEAGNGQDFPGGWTSEIHEAVWLNNLERVSALIAQNVDLENSVEDCTPLYLACLKGHRDVAEALIRGGAQVDRDSPPIFAAAGKGNLELVKMLLDKGADPSKFSTQHAGCCALHIAAEKNYVDVATLLLDAGVLVDVRSLKQQLTPLISAACCGCEATVELLLTRGADINAQSSTGNTALMLAIDRGKIPVAQLLISRGAGLEITGQKGWTALHNAASGGDKGYLEVAQALIQAGANVNAQSETKLTPLHEAAGKSLVPIVRLLVESGAQPDARDKYKNTPLRMCASNAQSFATLESFKETVEILLSAGADINAGTTINTTALHSVVKWGNIDAVRFMLEKGANPDAMTKKDELPIDFAKDPAIYEVLAQVTKAQRSEKSAESGGGGGAGGGGGGNLAGKGENFGGKPEDGGVVAKRQNTEGGWSWDNWMPDKEATQCGKCGHKFTFVTRKHHCRNCGLIFCDKCTAHREKLPDKGMKEPVRICDGCFEKITSK